MVICLFLIVMVDSILHFPIDLGETYKKRVKGGGSMLKNLASIATNLAFTVIFAGGGNLLF